MVFWKKSASWKILKHLIQLKWMQAISLCLSWLTQELALFLKIMVWFLMLQIITTLMLKIAVGYRQKIMVQFLIHQIMEIFQECIVIVGGKLLIIILLMTFIEVMVVELLV